MLVRVRLLRRFSALGERNWEPKACYVFVSPPGEVHDPSGLADAHGWAVFFPAEVLAAPGAGVFLSWRAHPLLFPFVAGAEKLGGGARRLVVPKAERPAWSARLSALDLELRERREGYREAAMAHLTLLLVGVSRLAVRVVGDLRLNDEPLLAEVFGFVEDRYRDHVSLKDVARAVSLSPCHLTTVVRRKAGRTVLEWSPSGAWRRRGANWSRPTWRWRRWATGSATKTRATSCGPSGAPTARRRWGGVVPAAREAENSRVSAEGERCLPHLR